MGRHYRPGSSHPYHGLWKQAVQRGWTVELTANNHLRWTAPSGRSTFSAFTPSSHRAVKNLRTKLRRYGL